MKSKASGKRKGIGRRIIWLFILLAVFVYLNNTSIFLRHQSGQAFLLAHRGLAQTFPMEGITAETNTARRIYEPEHPYLENTLPSMEAAFEAGADMVELDIQLTRDLQFAVFHDDRLEYRTDGFGSIREYTMEELKTLDVGYSYTADNGKSYPFRGKGVGLMPSLDEVLDHFPDCPFLIHIKSNDPQEGEQLAKFLEKLPQSRRKQLAVYGGDEPIAVLQKKLPDLKVMSKSSMKKALLSYMLVGWTGYIPAAMRNAYFHLPQKYARILWGWPHRFIDRMKDVNSLFVLVSGDGQWSEGFDTAEDLKELPYNYRGGIWTNRIDRIAPLIRGR
ncbi:MAG: glycerophosphodiester phosphodiesterase family protein [Clostridia bacterium]|jgi:glycerophosphoryl diester phosphodiesterase